MTKELVARWFNKLGNTEKDLPLLLVDGYAYTPRMAYSEVMNGTALGVKMQALIEMGRFGTTVLDEQAIAKVRLQQILQNKPDKPMFATLSNKAFTPRELLEEINSGTLIGQQWVSGEISRMHNLVKMR